MFLTIIIGLAQCVLVARGYGARRLLSELHPDDQARAPESTGSTRTHTPVFSTRAHGRVATAIGILSALDPVHTPHMRTPPRTTPWHAAAPLGPTHPRPAAQPPPKPQRPSSTPPRLSAAAQTHRSAVLPPSAGSTSLGGGPSLGVSCCPSSSPFSWFARSSPRPPPPSAAIPPGLSPSAGCSRAVPCCSSHSSTAAPGDRARRAAPAPRTAARAASGDSELVGG